MNLNGFCFVFYRSVSTGIILVYIRTTIVSSRAAGVGREVVGIRYLEKDNSLSRKKNSKGWRILDVGNVTCIG